MQDVQLNEKTGDIKGEDVRTRTNVVAVDELDFDGKHPAKHQLHAGIRQGQYFPSGFADCH